MTASPKLTAPDAAARPRPTQPARPSRTPYRPAPNGPTFRQALEATQRATKAGQQGAELLSQALAGPSAAAVGAPIADESSGASPAATSTAPLDPAALAASTSDLSALATTRLEPTPSALAAATAVGTAPIGTPAPALWHGLMRSAPIASVPAGRAVTSALAASSALTTSPLTSAATPAARASANGASTNGVSPNTQALRPPASSAENAQTFLRSIAGFDQTNVDEYESQAQARAWGHSTCSAASLTAVLRAAGQDVRIADVMRAMPGGMTIQLGLVSRPALVNAATQFGATAVDDVVGYEALKAATGSGQPVLLDIRNSRFPEGHWIVVTGVDDGGVRVADSSRYNLTSISRGELLSSWKSGRGIRLGGLALPASSRASTARAV
ncbi:MAG: C39 family peptidase [Chloroflexi bacterium]|nr:C39 family peptidase [Chloroflexota bacterium]